MIGEFLAVEPDVVELDIAMFLSTQREGRRSLRAGPSRYGHIQRLFNMLAVLALWTAMLAVPLVPAPVGAMPGQTPANKTVSEQAPMARTVKILALGDSLTAGYGLPEEEGFPRQLERTLNAMGYKAQVINAGVSGDTTAGGLSRLDWALADQPDMVIVELGANDGLRGLDPGAARTNLDQILKRLTERNIPTLLAGMYAPPNLGRDYGDAFNAIYPELAQKYGVMLYPFFLDGVAGETALNQGDGIHPNAKGVSLIVRSMAPYIADMIDTQVVQQGG